jgi:hypothetical protein
MVNDVAARGAFYRAGEERKRRVHHQAVSFMNGKGNRGGCAIFGRWRRPVGGREAHGGVHFVRGRRRLRLHREEGDDGIVGCTAWEGRWASARMHEENSKGKETGCGRVWAESKWAARESITMVLSILCCRFEIWFQGLNPKQNYFQIQTKFKPSPKMEIWDFWIKVNFEIQFKI